MTELEKAKLLQETEQDKQTAPEVTRAERGS